MISGNLESRDPGSAAAVFRSTSRKRCLEMRLVLAAAGIAAAVRGARRDWWLVVAAQDRTRAERELDAYRVEHEPHAPPHEPAIPQLPGALSGVAVYAAVLTAVAVLSDHDWVRADWLAAGRMQAGAVLDGQWWRVFTALTLHLDAGHLLANLFFGALLGLFVGQTWGGGVAWLGILLAGGMGNALNAVIQPPQHSAVGASTAVFAALGLLVSWALHFRRRLPGGVVRRWSPLIGGLLLLAYTGFGGGRTDVMAHVTGLVCGLLLGLVGLRLPASWLARRDVQGMSGAAAVLLLLLSWRLAW